MQTSEPHVYRGSQFVFRFYCINSDLSAFVFDNGDSFYFGIDNSYDPLHDDLVFSLNAQFNIGSDWALIDLASGQICCRVNTDTVDLANAMGAAANVTYPMELWCISGGKPVLLLHTNLIIDNIAVEPNNPSSSSSAP